MTVKVVPTEGWTKKKKKKKGDRKAECGDALL